MMFDPREPMTEPLMAGNRLIRNFDDVLDVVHEHPVRKVAVACADSGSVLEACMLAARASVAKPILVGDKAKILTKAERRNLDLTGCELVDIADAPAAASHAVALVAKGEADIVMKGHLHTDDFLRAVLQREDGLRTGKLLSHVFLLEAKHLNKLIMVTDGAMNIAPDFEKKAVIARNAIALARLFGIDQPHVACLAAVELVNPSMQATQDAAILSLMSHRGQFEHGVVEGPFALDNAISELAAQIKGIQNPVAGRADILLCPNIEVGNVLAKSFVYLAQGRLAGVIVGAKAPVVLTSRADTAESKLLSIATAVYMANIEQVRVKVGRHR